MLLSCVISSLIWVLILFLFCISIIRIWHPFGFLKHWDNFLSFFIMTIKSYWVSMQHQVILFNLMDNNVFQKIQIVSFLFWILLYMYSVFNTEFYSMFFGFFFWTLLVCLPIEFLFGSYFILYILYLKYDFTWIYVWVKFYFLLCCL